MEDYRGGRRGIILVPEGRKGEGWKSFVSELRVVVKHIQSINGGGNSKLKPVSISTAEVLMHTAKEPEPPRRRSFVEVMMHSTKETEPVTLKTRPTVKGLKELVMLTEKKRRALVKTFALKDGVKKSLL